MLSIQFSEYFEIMSLFHSHNKLVFPIEILKYLMLFPIFDIYSLYKYNNHSIKIVLGLNKKFSSYSMHYYIVNTVFTLFIFIVCKINIFIAFLFFIIIFRFFLNVFIKL
ncbi:hypothetical protein UT300003_12990 [Clostridium sardiniense]